MPNSVRQYVSFAVLGAAMAMAPVAAQHTGHGAPHQAQQPATQVFKIGALEIAAPWLRQPPDGGRVAGGYMRITNTGATADRLLSGSSPLAKRFELHEMAMDNGVMRMRELARGIEIKPGETVELKPGGLHVMYLDITTRPQAGKSVKTTLTFEQAGTIDLEVPVVPASAAPGGTKAGHSHH